MIRELKIPNKKSLKLSAILSTPDDGNKFPLMLLLQGFLGKKEGEKLRSLSAHLLKLGVASMRFDYSGYGQSEGETEQEYLISNFADDLDCVFNFLESQSDIDCSRLGVWGQSMGGMLAIILASTRPEIKIVCAVSTPAQITIGDDLEKLVGLWKQNGYLERKNSKGELVRISYEFIDDARKWNVLKLIKKIKVPLLIILGKKDGTVLPTTTRRIYKAANEPKQLVEIDDMPHDYKDRPIFIEEINTISGNFAQKYLLA